MIMLICLILWLDLPDAFMTLFVMFVGYNDILTDNILFKTSLIKLYGQQGILLF